MLVLEGLSLLPGLRHLHKKAAGCRMWTQEDGSSWMQYVAKEASSRLEVVTIQQHLEQKLMQRQARETGICAVREDLYKQLFGTLT